MKATSPVFERCVKNGSSPVENCLPTVVSLSIYELFYCFFSSKLWFTESNQTHLSLNLFLSILWFFFRCYYKCIFKIVNLFSNHLLLDYKNIFGFHILTTFTTTLLNTLISFSSFFLIFLMIFLYNKIVICV